MGLNKLICRAKKAETHFVSKNNLTCLISFIFHWDPLSLGGNSSQYGFIKGVCKGSFSTPILVSSRIEVWTCLFFLRSAPAMRSPLKIYRFWVTGGKFLLLLSFFWRQIRSGVPFLLELLSNLSLIHISFRNVLHLILGLVGLHEVVVRQFFGILYFPHLCTCMESIMYSASSVRTQVAARCPCCWYSDRYNF